MAARLKAIPSRLATAPMRLKPATIDRNDTRGRAEANAARRWYGSQRWRELSWQVRVEAAFTCAICKRVEGRKGQTVADHKRPHRGDEALFWDRQNLQCLCKPCHDSTKQAEEARR